MHRTPSMGDRRFGRVLYDDTIPAAMRERFSLQIEQWIRGGNPFELNLVLNQGASQAAYVDTLLDERPKRVALRKIELVSKYGRENFWLVEPLTAADAERIALWAEALAEPRPV